MHEQNGASAPSMSINTTRMCLALPSPVHSSFLGNRCADLVRCMLCLKKGQDLSSIFDVFSPMHAKGKDQVDEPEETDRLLGAV